MCACGKPLHYSDPLLQQMVQRAVDALGANVRVVVKGRVWLVPRHYIALHGLVAAELDRLGFPAVTERNTG